MSKGFFPDDDLKNENADQPWKRSETDLMLDKYFAGAHPDRIAHELDRNPKAVKRRIEQFTYNERDRATLYEPFRRVSRKEKRFTENETILLDEHRKRKVPPKFTALVLQRGLGEVSLMGEGQVEKKKVAVALDLPGIGVDVVRAHQSLYYFHMQPIISDAEYDAMKAEELEFGTGNEILLKRPGKTVYDIPEHIRHLGLYLMLRHAYENHVKWSVQEKKWVEVEL